MFCDFEPITKTYLIYMEDTGEFVGEVLAISEMDAERTARSQYPDHPAMYAIAYDEF